MGGLVMVEFVLGGEMPRRITCRVFINIIIRYVYGGVYDVVV